MATHIGPKSIRRFLLVLLLSMGLWLLSACTLLPPAGDDAEIGADEARTIFLGWEAMAEWQPVNVDGDAEDENLLLFRFDNGQVGALIQEGDPATSIATPERLLPRFFDEQGELGQGVIAAPGTPAAQIMIAQIDGDNPARELLLLGGGTHLTFAWSKGGGLGYGVTQLFAAGGFGVDWETWAEDPAPIMEIMGYTPLQDYRARANLCSLTLYTRRTDLPNDSPRITFRDQPQGLHFCGSTIPPYPVAPEAVVMAYLRAPRVGSAELINWLTPGTSVAQLDAESYAERWPLEYVADIAAYPSVPMAPVAAGETLSPTTAVCVEFAESANPTLRRWVVYTLRYQPADSTQRLADRWTVSGALMEPPPMEAPPAGYCTAILERNAP